MSKKKVLIFCDYYLPGYKSGGGMWTVVNLVSRFADIYEFHIVTRNHDGRSDTRPYDTVKTDEWNDIGNARAYYFGKGSLSAGTVSRLIDEVKPDAVFLNSMFSLPSIRFLNARRKGLLPELSVILAPCGETSVGALSIKPYKKKLFLKYASMVGLYDGVIWKASFDSEADEIRSLMGAHVEVMVAPDLLPAAILPDYDQTKKPTKRPGAVKFVFISRLSPKKNIHYFIERLCDVTEGDISLELIGPIEDRDYWKKCQTAIDRLPANVKVIVSGVFEDQHEALLRVMENHFFAMPTLNENFGYVFIEALAAGCPLLISDRTVWSDLEDRGAGWRIPLEDPDGYTRAIRECLEMTDEGFQAMAARARQYALDQIADPRYTQATANVLSRAMDIASLPANNAR